MTNENNEVAVQAPLGIEVAGLIHDTRGAYEAAPSVDGDEYGEIILLDPIVAELREAERMRLAGPRKRITTDDLDRMQR